MIKYTKKKIEDASQIVSTTINKCEKMQPKFLEGTSQHSLLKNRIKALYIAKALINNENIIEKYSKEEIINALKPVSSIISKCEKAQLKFLENTPNYARFKSIITAMYISKSFINEEINRRD